MRFGGSGYLWASGLWAVGILAAVGVGSGAAGAQTLPQFGEGVHLGVTSCAGSTCHGAVEPFKQSNVMQNEYVTWSQKDRHAKAYKVLLEERSVRIAKNLGLPNAQTAEICLNCHADNAADNKRGRQFQIADGVACESCHGGSSGWLGIHISGGSHQDNIKAGLYPTDDPVARAKLCMSCHIGSQSNKFVSHRIMGAGHPRMSIELDTFTAIQPAHYVVDQDYVKRKGQPNGVQVWAIGQATALAETMDAFLDPKRNPAGMFPELVFYDCHACHHPMSNIRWEPRASTGLGPGVVKFNDANALMLRVIAQRIDEPAGRALADHTRAMHKAMTENREQSMKEAAALRDVANQLVTKFASHQFGQDDMRALLTGVVNEGLIRHEYVEYAAAEQATMALSSIINAMKNMGAYNDAQFKQANSALGKLYDAVAKDEEYKSATFLAALRDFQQGLPAVAKQ
jgi:cytochrome c554/c'-like protein